MRGLAVRSLLALVAAVVLLVGGGLLYLMVSTQPAARFMATLDQLDVPAGWDVLHTTAVDGSFVVRARATRYYVTDLPAPAAGVDAAIAVLTQAGFGYRPERASLDGCLDRDPSTDCTHAFRDACASDGSCLVRGIRPIGTDGKHVEHVLLAIASVRAIDVENDDEPGPIEFGRERVTVTIQVDRVPAEAYADHPADWAPSP